MERLTKQLGDKYFYKSMPYQDNFYIAKVVTKLGHLEDIEEELGIPLEVLLKALKDGVWVKGDKWIYNYKVLDFGLSIQEWAIYNDDFFRSTKDYGKTWALTREELE